MTQKIFCILIMSLVSSMGFAAKKNVCSITLNSNEEIELFKSKLSAKEFNFTELTLTKSKAKPVKSEDGEVIEEEDSRIHIDWSFWKNSIPYVKKLFESNSPELFRVHLKNDS